MVPVPKLPVMPLVTSSINTPTKYNIHTCFFIEHLLIMETD